MVKLTGTIAGIAADLSRSEPIDASIADAQASGATLAYTFTGFSNDGNVPQTLTVSGVSGAVNCTIGDVFIVRGADEIVGPLELQPGQTCGVKVNFTVAETAIGDSDLPFEFTLDYSWS